MAKNIRMSAKDYREEFDNLTVKRMALKARIAMRLLTLCNQYPNAPIGLKADKDSTIILAKSYNHSNAISSLSVDSQIHIIDTIEKHIASLHPHKQTKIDYNA